MYTELLDRESLRGEDGVKYYKNTLRPRFIKGALSVFLFVQRKKNGDGQVDWKNFIIP